MISGIGGAMDPTQRYGGMHKNPFNKMDENSDGSLDASELVSMAEKLSEKTGTTIDSSDIISKLDTDDDGVVSQDEFAAGRHKGPPPEMMGPGQRPISGQSSQQFLDMLNQSDDEALSSIKDSLDLNGDGIVDAEEAKKGMGIVLKQYMNQVPEFDEARQDTESQLNFLI